METPAYIKNLLVPSRNGETRSRKVWSIELEGVWLPFFTATNAVGETSISPEALGAPLRLSYTSDGEVKFSKTGRPVLKVNKELSEQIRLVRKNFTANLLAFANGVIAENPEAYQEEVAKAREAGEPIILADKMALEQAIVRKKAQEIVAMAEEKPEEGKEAKAKAEGKTEAKELAEVKA